MTPGPGFDLAAALPFAVPGPTNTLVAIGSARHRRAARAGRHGAGQLRRGDRGLDRTRRTRHGLIFIHVAAMPLRRMVECASVALGRATGSPMPRTQARLQRQSAKIPDRSSHAEQRRANENARAGPNELLKYP